MIQTYLTPCVVSVLLVKSFLMPGWVSAVELIAGLIFISARWFTEPKPVSPSEIEEIRTAINNLVDEVKRVDGRIGVVKMQLGLRG